MDESVYLNIGTLCYAIIGLLFALLLIIRYNRTNSKLLAGIYAMYASTIAYLVLLLLYGYTGRYIYNIASIILFNVFLTIAMPWSLYVYFKLTEPKKNDKDEKTTQV